MRGRLLALAVLGLAAWGRPYVSQTRSLEEVLKNAGARIAALIQTLKTQPENPFYARTVLSLNEQRDLASTRVETIKKLLDARGFDSPDYSRILELTTDILRKAPDTPYARAAHWNIHQYYLIMSLAQPARDALLTFLDKYEADESAKKEAYDKLARYAADEKEWDAVLYFSEKHLSIDPGSHPQLLNKARALVNLGFLVEGKALLHRIVEEVPDSVQASLAASALAELEDAEFNPELVAGYKTTMEIMRQIGTAAASYWAEYAKYPPSIKDLYPVFLRELTEKDAWGTPFFIKSDPDAEQFMIASAGSDGRFDGFDQKGSYIDLPGKDIIFAAGSFVFAPQIRTP